MPASKVSRISYSWRARRFVATTRSPLRSSRAAARLAGICFFALAMKSTRVPCTTVLPPAPGPYTEMVAHCLAGLPDEACGLLVGPYGGDEVCTSS